MQRITYTNLRGEVLDFYALPPLILGSVKGTGLPDHDAAETKGVFQAGSTTRKMLDKERFVEIEFSILTNTREDLYRARKILMSKLSTQSVFDPSGPAMGRLIYENDLGRWWAYARPDGPPKEAKRFLNAFPAMSLTFRCDNPYWQSLEEYNVQMALGNGGFVLPIKLPFKLGGRNFSAVAHNAGTVSTPVTIVITGAGEKPSIINMTTGAKISLSRQLAVGETLTVHTAPDTLSVTVRKVDGQEESAFGYLDEAVTISAFVLIPGDNKLVYAPSELSPLSRAEVRWRTREEGV